MTPIDPREEGFEGARTGRREAAIADVLVVDDEPDLRATTVRILADAGYSVVACSNGREALNYLASCGDRMPAVIVLDLMMPIMDGWQFCAEQRMDPRLTDIPVVVVSAVLDTAAAPPATRANAYLEKPIDPTELLEAVRTCCEPPRS